MNKFLTPGDLNSTVWFKVEAALKHELGVLSLKLENDADAATTAKLRGQIQSLRSLLNQRDGRLSVKPASRSEHSSRRHS